MPATTSAFDVEELVIVAEAVAAVTDVSAPDVLDLANEDDVATPAVAELARDLDSLRAELDRLKRTLRDCEIMLATLIGEDLPMESTILFANDICHPNIACALGTDAHADNLLTSPRVHAHSSS